MDIPTRIKRQTCMDCLSGHSLGFDIKMAFQPIIDWQQQDIFAYEALVRGPQGQGAGWVFERVNDDNKYYFDQMCRVRAIETAARLGCDRLLSINFLPNAIYNPDTCIRATIEASEQYGFDLKKIIFEVSEGERIVSQQKLKRIFESYARYGFYTAIDDYGAGFTSPEWLHSLKPAIVKLDMDMVRDIHQDPVRQQRLAEAQRVCAELGALVLAEGIETVDERDYLVGAGVRYLQGYLFARPMLEALSGPGQIRGWH
ncbi:EAL domain-containing protein [Oceanimonas pelagia]|uniref:EAL domain-containing protein n=1 Tax=Oceanimonas pelagia TaxID=3028314 RepID=A0AA50KNM3_9GAMM|nr:EAL domain-containing protein [Oceanimonas pelagia]WMC10843.1 EAL domain-containing protein [Oceanimonas pelagia]